MARPKNVSNLTKEEIKAKKAELKAARKTVIDSFAKVVADHRHAEKAVNDLDKAHAKARKSLVKSLDAAASKLSKAEAARDKGLGKIDAQLQALTPATAD